MKPSAAGYTLLEMLVVIVIIGIVSALLLRGYPVLRAQQQLKAAEQQIQSTMREAQALALNETREADCVAGFGANNPDQRLCSDIGVSFSDSTMTLFADLNSNDQFDAGDDLIKAVSLSGSDSTRVAAPVTFVWRARPPKVWLSQNLDNLNGDRTDEVLYPLRVQTSRLEATLTIGSYGQVTRAN